MALITNSSFSKFWVSQNRFVFCVPPPVPQQQSRRLPKPCSALAVVQLGPLIFSAGGTAKLLAQMCLLWPRQMSQQVLAEPDLPAFGRGCRRRKARQEPVAVWGCCTPGPSVMAQVWIRPLLFMVLLSAAPARLPERPHNMAAALHLSHCRCLAWEQGRLEGGIQLRHQALHLHPAPKLWRLLQAGKH